MNVEVFDRSTVVAGEASSRRRVLGGLAAAVGALVLGDAALAEKGGNGKGKGKDKGKGNAHGKNKVGICHKTDEGFVYKTVPGPAWNKGHRKHGDFLCVPEGAADDPCKTYTQVCDGVALTCSFTANVGAVCTAEGDAAGTCDANGVCVPDTDTTAPEA